MPYQSVQGEKIQTDNNSILEKREAGEMAHLFRALTSLVENTDRVLSTHMAANNYL